MSEIVFFSDTHLGLDEPQKPRICRPRRGPDFLNNFRGVLEVARRRRVEAVIHGGDLFFRSRVPQSIVDTIYGIIHEFLECGIPLLMVPGNHERSRLPPSLFLAHPLLYVFDVPKTVVLPVSRGILAVGGFPSVRNDIRDVFSSLVKATGLAETKADFRLLCMHQTIEGAHVGPGHFVFRGGPDVIPRSLLPRGIDGILAGHIHRSQVHVYEDVRTGRAIPILYPGSTERTSFAERDETKGYFLLKLGSSEFEETAEGDKALPLSPSRFPGRKTGLASWEFQELPARPMLDLKPPSTLVPPQFRAWLGEQLQSCPERAIIRIHVSPPLEQAFRNAKDLFPPDAILEYRPPAKNEKP